MIVGSLSNHQSSIINGGSMPKAQGIIEKIKADIQGGKSEEEIFQYLFPSLRTDPETLGKIAEFLAAISDVKAAKLLYRMLEVSEDKKVRKTIKRSLYQLKMRGIPTEEPLPEKEGSILRPPKAETPQGFGSAIDFLGRRLLVLAIPHPGMGLMVMEGLTSDVQGLMDVAEIEVTRKGFKFFLEDLQKSLHAPLVEIEASYVGFLFTEAYQRTLRSGGTQPKGYGALKREIERVSKRYEEPLIYSRIQREEIAKDDRSLERGKDLLKADLFAGWKIEDDQIRPYAEAVSEARGSRIVLAESQKEARFQEIYLKALSDLFSDERRFLYKRRLEETAYLLLKLGKEEEAKICLATAVDMEKPVNPIGPNPFLFQLVVNSALGLLAESHEKEEKEPSLIVRP